MSLHVKIGIIGDFDGRPSHLATQSALLHSAERIGIEIDYQWMSTQIFENTQNGLESFDGLWGAPGSPYKSLNGAVNAIRFARENNVPFLGTCGGFQHAVIEYGRNVLHIDALTNPGFDLYAPNAFISELSCSLVGQTRQIQINSKSRLYGIYGAAETQEKYNCSFGLNKSFQDQLDASGFKVAGVDEDGEARVMLTEGHPFFIVTLFQPQLSSEPDKPHPLITEYLAAVTKLKASR